MPLIDSLIDAAKRVPLDLGQGNLRFTTQGKLIAQAHVPTARPGQTALDLGCREGAQSRWLEAKGYAVTSVDVEKVYEKAEVVDADEPLPFENESFDLVWSSEVIEHLADPAFSLRELRRILRPGGRLVITTPNSYAWFYRILDRAGFPPHRLQHPGHKSFFRLTDMERLFPDGRIYGYFPYVGVKATIQRGLGPLTPTFVVVEDKPSAQ